MVPKSSRTLPLDYPDRIKRLRERFDLTQVRLASLLSVSFASVNRWENGQARPSNLAWRRIVEAEQFGIEVLTAPTGDGRAGWSRETAAVYKLTPDLDFQGSADRVWIVAEGERLSNGHLFNPTFATEISAIDPLPHQRIAVYEHMLPQPRLRFLLADDAGAGKTIMTGLYIREMLSRRLIRRALIVPPAGLVGNWQRELRLLFGLPFQLVQGSDAEEGNPFVGPDSDLVIISVDTLASDRMFRRLQDPEVTPFDLVVFDEAHKLSAHRDADLYVRRTDRYRLAEAIAGASVDDQTWQLNWTAHHLLLLTATPHMGKDYPYYALWQLLEPYILATPDAFHKYPLEERGRNFIRRVKEEMYFLDGRPMYPQRISDTLSYDLIQGDVSEQSLYDRTSSYVQDYYNRARVLNRSAAQLAMSVFQRRLASSTYAVLRSFERRLAKLDGWIDGIRSGRITPAQLRAGQRELDRTPDILLTKTADEERPEEGREENELIDEQLIGGVVATTLADLETERRQVQELLDLARRVDVLGHESKFQRLAEIIREPQYRDEKILIFTEHRDTMDFLVRRLEGIGFAGQVARIHGGMPFDERDAQVEVFRKPAPSGGANILVATDAAGEGINLQFCWLMVNYDIPWNPARLEQRLGRIHRYGQKHDPVVILNLVAGRTREGRVLKTLLDKLEKIRKEMQSDKVFDVVGRVFEGVSIREYMELALTEDGTGEAQRRIEGTLTGEQVEALRQRERLIYGEGGDVRPHLTRLRAEIDREAYRRLLPGYVRRFLERSAPLLDIGIEGDLESLFNLTPAKPGAMDQLWPVFEMYDPELRDRLTLFRPQDPRAAIFVHPGEPVFESLRSHASSLFSSDALRGALFVDPAASKPYFFHLALVSVERGVDTQFREFARPEVAESRLVGLIQAEDDRVESCGAERLLLLRGGTYLSPAAFPLLAQAATSRDVVTMYAVEHIARPMAAGRRNRLLADLPLREDFLNRGFQYREAELAEQRARVSDKARQGDPEAKALLTRIRSQQTELAARRDSALAVLHREADLVGVGEVKFVAHALVMPSSDPEERKRYDEEIEAIGMRVARAHEETLGAVVLDVSRPELARAAGFGDSPGFDLFSRRADGKELAIEVKGRARVGDIQVSENEWAKAYNLRDRYWLYVAYDCASANPKLIRIQDPFFRLLVRAKGGVIIDEQTILQAMSNGGQP